MKSIIFLADGMADEPLDELGGLTPLEYADTPAMDFIAKSGQSGTFLTLPEGLPTSSDVANMSVLGFYPEKNYPGRGPIEAASQGIQLAPDDVAWRCNLVYVDEENILRDYSAGHISDAESKKIIAALKEKFDSDKLTFHPGVSYRNLLVLHGKEFSDAVDYFKPDSSQDIPVAELRLKAKTPEAEYTVNFLGELSRQTADFLAGLECNRRAGAKANFIWPWSPGRKPALPGFSSVYGGKRGAIISAVDVIKGLGRCTGMDVIEVPGATGYLDTNYEGKANAAVKALKDHDFVYLHLEAIDECSHEGDLKKKLQAIENFDSRIIAPVMKQLSGEEVVFAILPDHPVPIKLRKHTTTPVPVAVCGPGFPPDGIEKYSERQALNGSLGNMRGNELIKKVLAL